MTQVTVKLPAIVQKSREPFGDKAVYSTTECLARELGLTEPQVVEQVKKFGGSLVKLISFHSYVPGSIAVEIVKAVEEGDV